MRFETGIEVLQDAIQNIVVGSTVQASGPESTAVDTTCVFYVALEADGGGPAAEADITAGTYDIVRTRAGVPTTIVDGGTSSKEQGRVFFTYTFPNADWEVGDTYRIVFEGIQNDGEAQGTITFYGQIAAAQSVQNVYDIVNHATYGNSALNTDLDAVLAILESATFGNSAIHDDVAVVDGVADAINTIVSSGTHGNAALKTLLDTIAGYADILDDATNGNAAIRAVVDSNASALVNRALRHGRVLLSNPGDSASTTGWSNSSTGFNSITVDSSIYHSAPSAIRATAGATVSNPAGIVATLTDKAKRFCRYYGSVWVYPSVPMRCHFAIQSSGALTNRYFDSGGTYVSLPALQWTRIEGIATLSGATESGNLLVVLRMQNNSGSALVQNDYFVVDDCLIVELDGAYEDYQFRRVMHKDGNLTFNSATDSLEAIRDHLDTIRGAGSPTLESITTAIDALPTTAGVNAEVDSALNTIVPANPTAGALTDILSKAPGGNTFDKSTDSLEAIRDYLTARTVQAKTGRSADSGSTVMDGTEKTLYEESHTTPWKFEGGWIDLTSLADGKTVVVKVYAKIESGGSYLELSSVTLTGSADAKVYPCPASFPIGGSTQKVVIPSFWNTYGVKVTAQQTVVGGGYITVKGEWFDTKSGEA